ncbi:uncharacterized protein WCC33_014794 [Rhinophrynus dorsalis]
MKDGSGVINLATLGDSEGFLVRDMKVHKKEVSGSKMEETVTFSPCLPFSEPAALVNCSHVAACVVTRDPLSQGGAPLYLGFGQHDGNEFLYNNESKILSVSYGAIPGSPLHTVVHYNCSPTKSVTFPANTHSPDLLEIFVNSPCVCPSSCQSEDVGPGTIILIMFAVSTAIYFLYGTCSLHSIQMSEGDEINTESSIWCWICFLFRRQREPKNSLLANF